MDVNLNYQYKAFGVPGLGLKRGLGEDLVIAPYATVMALMVMPEQAFVIDQFLQRYTQVGVINRLVKVKPDLIFGERIIENIKVQDYF